MKRENTRFKDFSDAMVARGWSPPESAASGVRSSGRLAMKERKSYVPQAASDDESDEEPQAAADDESDEEPQAASDTSSDDESDEE